MSNLPLPGALIGTAIGLFAVGVIFFLPIGTVEEIVTEYTNEPLAHQESLVREAQVSRWIFWDATEVQYIVKNNDVTDGTFTLNFVFNNGEEIKSSTRRIKILAGAQEAVTQVSAFNGVSSVVLNVIPPYKVVAHQRTVSKDVTLWDRIWDLKAIFGIK